MLPTVFKFFYSCKDFDRSDNALYDFEIFQANSHACHTKHLADCNKTLLHAARPWQTVLEIVTPFLPKLGPTVSTSVGKGSNLEPVSCDSARFEQQRA